MESTPERDSADRRKPPSHGKPSSNQVRTINLALQGGGAHGAFTWGVLDRLLDEKDLAFEGLSATSAGAMNAAAFAYGLAVDGREVLAECPLPVAGLLSDASLDDVIAQSRACNDAAAALGWTGATPFLTVSFLALSVIPHLKITDRGLVDVDLFEFVPLAR